jgi:hypothetical protein
MRGNQGGLVRWAVLCLFLVSFVRVAKLQNESEATEDDVVDVLGGGEASQEELQSLLHWAIQHSDHSALKEAARGGGEGGKAEAARVSEERMEELREVMADLNAQKSEADLMKEAVQTLDSTSEPTLHKESALLKLEDLVGQIDNANDFAKFGLQTLLLTLESEESTLRLNALQVLGTAASNNVEFQELALQSHPKLVEMLYRLVETERVDEVKSKAVYALSSILRNSIPARNAFYKLDGPKLIVDLLSGDGSQRLKRKALTLASDLQMLEMEYDIHSFSDRAFASILNELLKSGDPDISERSLTMIQLLSRINPDTKENFRAVGILSTIDDFLSGIKSTLKNESATLDEVYLNDLLSLGRSVLKDIDIDPPEKEEL